MGLIDIRLSEEVIGFLFDESLFVEGIFGKEEDKVEEEDDF